MFEDNAFEDEYFNNHSKQTVFEAEKRFDGTDESGVSRSLPQLRRRHTELYKRESAADQINDLNQPIGAHVEDQNVKDSCPKSTSIFVNQSGEVKAAFEKNQLYKTDVHISKYTDGNIIELKTGSCENTLSHRVITHTESLSDNFKRMPFKSPDKHVNYKKISPSEAGFKMITPHMQEVGGKEAFTISGKTTQETVSQKVPLKKNCLRKGTYTACPNNETKELLDNAIQYFRARKEYLSYGNSSAKSGKKAIWYGNPTFQGQFRNHPNEVHYNPVIKTLRDSLKYFNLTYHLQLLEMNLESLRRNKLTKEDYEERFKKIDKEIQKLSFKHHPDKVKNRGGTEEDIERAQKEQTALNSTRTALKFLNSAFLKDIATDHKFEFYTNLNIESLCNEDEMKQRVYEVIFKIGMISRIKQRNIISQIRKFLIESERCVDSYLKNPNSFENQRDLALFRLKCCVECFKKLNAGLEEVKVQCESEENGKNMLDVISKMARESNRDLELLKSLKKTAEASVKGMYQFFSPVEEIDPYFVLPLVSYDNVILMCNVMVRNASKFENFINNIIAESVPNDLCYLMRPYYLASYCSGNKYYSLKVLEIMNESRPIEQRFQLPVSKEEIELEFYERISEIKGFMEIKFRVEEYNETMPVSLFLLDLKKCMKMMAEFQAKEQEVSKGIEEFQKKTELMDEKYANIEKMMEAAAKLDREYKERIEQNKKISEQFSNSLLDQI